jgi:hypothetical protein
MARMGSTVLMARMGSTVLMGQTALALLRAVLKETYS